MKKILLALSVLFFGCTEDNRKKEYDACNHQLMTAFIEIKIDETTTNQAWKLLNHRSLKMSSWSSEYRMTIDNVPVSQKEEKYQYRCSTRTLYPNTTDLLIIFRKPDTATYGSGEAIAISKTLTFQ